jgi:hypothetical protein
MTETRKQTFRWMLGCGLLGLAVVVGTMVAGDFFLDRMYEGEMPVTRVANYEEWLEKGGGTWLDVSIPKSIRDFCEVHDMDSNRIYARFYIAPEDIDQLGTDYTEIVQRNTPTWPPAPRIFLREYFECAGCDPVQHRLVADVKTGLIEFNPDSPGWLKERCSAL